mgnify:CR=1 FL=1
MRRGLGSGGFSLLELLIVVGVILIIATIAIPSLLRSRQTANESTAVANLRNVSSAEASYLSTTGGYYGTLTHLVDEELLDDRFSTGAFSGYQYTVAVSGFEYTAEARPLTTTTGRYAFYLIADGVIRYSTFSSMAPAGQAGRPVN